LNFSAPKPFGVFGATTWLNLMTIGACASAAPGTAMMAAAAAASRSLRMDVSFPVVRKRVFVVFPPLK
jgi:hypothetical protein